MDTALSISNAAKDMVGIINDFSQKLSSSAKLFEDILAQVNNTQQTATETTTQDSQSTSTSATTQSTDSSAIDKVMQLLLSNQVSTGSTTSSTTSATQSQSTSSPISAVNSAAVTAALKDTGTTSNGLKIYQADPTSNAWRSENITDTSLRRYIETLPLGRDTTLQVLSANDPLAEIGNIYKTMGTYATVDAAGDKGGKTLTIHDNSGQVLDSLTWQPDKFGSQSWASQDASTLQTMLKAYGIDTGASADFSSIDSALKNLNQTAPSGSYAFSPSAQYERYGLKTDPITKEVVGGGSTSAIDYYKSTGKLPPASAVWATVNS